MRVSTLSVEYQQYSESKILQNNIPKYFQNKDSYSNERSVASKIFNYKRRLQQLTSIVFPRIPYLVPALAHSFCMLHVAM